ncbi:MAG: DUF2800 domain-containing protein [Ilumatobacteraceae bacterium]
MQPRLSLSPSAAGRWMTCTASPQYLVDNADRLDTAPRDYTDEGTVAHDWAARILLDEAVVSDIPDEEMREHVAGYVEYCDYLRSGSDVVGVEEKLPLFYMPERNGIIDFWVLKDRGLRIVDFKYGAGVEVDVEDNPQLLIYALSALATLDADANEVTLTIYQPRCGDEPIRTVKYAVESLEEFREDVLAVVADIDAGRVEFAPSENACRFCPAAAFCSAKTDEHLAMLPDFEPVEPVQLPDPEAMTDDQLAVFVRNERLFRKWLTTVDEYVLRRMEEGRAIQGLKLVEGRQGNRKWRDEAAAEKLLKPKLKQDTYIKKVISPAQAEKLLKGQDLSTRYKSRFESLVGRAPGKPVVVVDDDKRVALAPVVDVLPDLDNLLD